MFYSSCKPGNRVADIFGDVESVFNHLFENSGSSHSGSFNPAWDVAELADSFDITFELPGIKPEDVKVEFEDGTLTVSGEKSVARNDEGVNYHRTERATGEFKKTLEFKSPINVDAIEASFDNGLLIVRVPKSEKAIARKIEVKSN